MKRNNKVWAAALFIAVLSQSVWAWKLPGLLSALSSNRGDKAASKAIKPVKQSSFASYPDTTVGDAFEEFFVDALVQFYVDEDGDASMQAFEMNGIPQDEDMQDALIEVIFEDD